MRAFTVAMVRKIWNNAAIPLASRTVSTVRSIQDVTVAHNENTGSSTQVSPTATITAVNQAKSIIHPRGQYIGSTSQALEVPRVGAWEWVSSTGVRVRHSDVNRDSPGAGGTTITYMATVEEKY